MIAVRVNTELEARGVLGMLHDRGYRWCDRDPLTVVPLQKYTLPRVICAWGKHDVHWMHLRDFESRYPHTSAVHASQFNPDGKFIGAFEITIADGKVKVGCTEVTPADVAKVAGLLGLRVFAPVKMAAGDPNIDVRDTLCITRQNALVYQDFTPNTWSNIVTHYELKAPRGD